MSLFQVIILAIAVSLDGLGAGLACGLKGVGIPFSSVALMGTAAGAAVFISMFAATVLGGLISARVAGLAGGLLLMGLGLYMFLHALRGREAGGVLALRQDPTRADADQSGAICGKEAAVLGFALAADGFGAGFGLGLAGLSPVGTGIAVTVANIIFISAGLKLGRLAASLVSKPVTVLPGLIIFCLGFVRVVLP